MKNSQKFSVSLVVALASVTSLVHAEDVPDFGFPVGFSIEKMDKTVSPKKDFPRYAAGRWREAAQIPSDTVRVSSLDLMARRVDVQVGRILDEAGKSSVNAITGSPEQQVGALFNAGMDEKHLSDLGISPLVPEFKRIEAIKNATDLAKAIAHYGLLTDEAIVLGAGVLPDTRDRTRYALLVADGELGLRNAEDYSKPESGPIREAYLKRIVDMLIIAETPPDKAKTLASKVLAIETRIAKVRQSPVDKADPNKRFVRMNYAELKAMMPSFDWDVYFETVGVVPPQEIIAIEVAALRERDILFRELSLQDQKDYLRWEILRYTTHFLTPDFVGPELAFSQAIYGDALRMPSRAKQVAGEIAKKLGQPLSRLYVEKHFSPESKHSVEDMIQRVRAQFRQRLEANRWLSRETRARAITKLDQVRITVGYPDQWIDFSSVDVRPDDYFGSVVRITEFLSRRNFAKLGTPVHEDSFNNVSATLPIIVNAAYDPTRNSIEIPAAFLQAPLYEPKADVAVNFCAVGSVIGHELTHGFDSQGRLYDAAGSVRNWWKDADAKRFNIQAAKLVSQANAYEVLPGLHANGALAVGENLADVGGIAFGYAALKTYLKEHPQENRRIDGLTPAQRCFISWAQVWADKSNEGFLRQVTAIDPHPPGGYRSVAPMQHEPGFYRAFGIRQGDPMWLAPSRRVTIW